MTQNLIPLASPASTTVTVTSHELLEIVNEERAKAGESTVRHGDFLARCRDELDGDFYETFVLMPEGRGRPSEGIRMNPDQCKLVAMRESKSVRRHVLARLKELEAKATQSAFQIPATLSAALRLAAEQAEQIEQQQAQLAIAAPKAQALDRISQAEGEKCISDAAKAMQMQPSKLFDWMDENGWIFRRRGKWVAYQDKIHAGCLRHRVTLVELKNGATKEVDQVVVTPKGQTKLAQVAA